jgi:hypothetical protein
MRAILITAILVFGMVSTSCQTRSGNDQAIANSASKSADSKTKIPVIVELFTSEGCSSCPPADRALKFLAEQQPVTNVEIIPLAFHVDYWNYLGWKDEFSAPQFSRRQELYVSRFKLDSAYTPEMVVDGQAEFVGNDTGKAAKLIADAAAREKGNVTASFDGDALVVSGSNLPKHETATVFLAVVEDNITSNVKHGENAGQIFNHSAVVRSLSALGAVEKASADFQLRISLPTITENQRIVIFVQDNTDRRILAAQSIMPKRLA